MKNEKLNIISICIITLLLSILTTAAMVTVSASDPQITDNTNITTCSDNLYDEKLYVDTMYVSNENELINEETQIDSLQTDCEEKLLESKDVNTGLNSREVSSEVNLLKFYNPKFESYLNKNYIDSYSSDFVCSGLTFSLTFQVAKNESALTFDKFINYYLEGDTITSIINETDPKGWVSLTHTMPTLSVYTLYHGLQNKLSAYDYTQKLNFKHKLKLTSNYNQYNTYGETPHMIETTTNSSGTQIFNITLKSNNLTFITTNSNGQPTFLLPSTYSLSSMYDVNFCTSNNEDEYSQSKFGASLKASSQTPTINAIIPNTFVYGAEDNIITVTLNDFNGAGIPDQTIKYKVDKSIEQSSITDFEGKVTIILSSSLKGGSHTFNYYYEESTNYNSVNGEQKTFNINPQESWLDTEDVSYSFVYGYSSGNVIVNLKDVNNNVFPGYLVNCTLWLGNEKISGMPTVKSGEAFSIPTNLAGGEYTLKYDFGGNENYSKSSSETFITINPQATSINTTDVSYSFIFNSESNTVTINLYNASKDLLPNKKISYTFNGEESKEAVSGEAFVLPITGLKVGDYTLSYQFMGDENYTKSNVVTTNINVIQQTPNISTPYLKYTFTYGVDNAIIVTLTDSKSNDPLEGKTIKYHFDSLTAETLITNSNGQVSIPVSKDLTAALNHILNYNFVGDYNYTNRTGLQVNFTINSRKTFVNNSMDHYIFIEGTNSNTVPVFLYDVYKTKLLTGKTIYYNINGVNGFTNDGIISIPNGLPGGRVYTLTYTFRGDDNYIKSSNSSLIFIQKITHFEGFNLSTINSSVNYTVCLKTLDGNVLSNESLLFVFNNTYYPVVTNVNGVACLSLNNLSLGSYNVDYVYFGNNLYTSSNGFSNINVVDKLKTDSNIILTYDVKGKVLNFNLTSNNIPINEANITVLINGTNYTLITDKDGLASIDLSNYSLGTYNLSYYYPGNKDINKCNGSCNISVTNPIDSVLTLNNYTMTVGLLGNLTGKLTTFNGTPLNGMVIFLNLTNLGNNLSKVYNVTSDINGDYALPINLAVGEYSASASYLGKTIGNNTYLNIGPVYSSISIKANMTFVGTVLSVNNLTETYGDGLNLTGKLLDINGKPVIGQHILLNLTRLSDGVSKIYPCTTDNTGEYQLEINLYPGEYSVSGSFNGLTVKNVTYSLSTIINGSILINKVVTVLSADEFLAKVNYGLIFTGKLINSESEPLSNQMISINLNNSRNGLSKTYYVYTDTNGVYSLVINLAKGSYTAQCSFTGTNEYESSIANTSLSIKA
ncbi:hypothetical protein [Methanobrevibacter sp. UBA417]|jgi:hypothetical protein|uniref:hypothetical protein n=2 Tax=unclassified Methanobrevibacter TaxID=2638681 RepID=UPI0039B9A9DF